MATINSPFRQDGVSLTISCGDPATATFVETHVEQHVRSDLETPIILLVDVPRGFALRASEYEDLSSKMCIVVTSNQCSDYNELLWEYGVQSLIDYEMLFDVFPEVLVNVSRGERCRYLPNHVPLLTPAERQTLRLLGDGLSNEQMSDRFSTSVYCVKNSVKSVLSKLPVQNRSQAGLYFWGMLEL
ncbi:MAG: helix-turn-helix transcriptional regulator [Chloroflexota bacterium]